MKIVYYCYGGSHSSVTAAAIHLGILPASRIPEPQEFMAVPYYDSQVKDEHGQYRLMGTDEKGNEIFIIGASNLDPIFETIVENTLEVFDLPKDEFLLVNSLKSVNNLMRVGGYLSRHLGLVTIGRPIVIKGTQAAYWDLVKMVDQVKKDVS